MVAQFITLTTEIVKWKGTNTVETLQQNCTGRFGAIFFFLALHAQKLVPHRKQRAQHRWYTTLHGNAVHICHQNVESSDLAAKQSNEYIFMRSPDQRIKLLGIDQSKSSLTDSLQMMVRHSLRNKRSESSCATSPKVPFQMFPKRWLRIHIVARRKLYCFQISGTPFTLATV